MNSQNLPRKIHQELTIPRNRVGQEKVTTLSAQKVVLIRARHRRSPNQLPRRDGVRQCCSHCGARYDQRK